MHIDKSLLCCNRLGSLKKKKKPSFSPSFLPPHLVSAFYPPSLSSLPLSCLPPFFTASIFFLKRQFQYHLRFYFFMKTIIDSILNQHVFQLVGAVKRGVNIAGQCTEKCPKCNENICLQTLFPYIIILNYFLFISWN